MSGTLALLGGSPLLDTTTYPAWPAVVGDEVAAAERVLTSGAWGSNVGGEVKAFEREFAEFQQSPHGTATVNGTIALVAALKAAGVGLGDEVIVPSYTFIATAAAALMIGAVPVFADVRADDHLIDPEHVATLVTPRTRAIIAVHLAGAVADMDALAAIARQHGLRLIEDAAQAAGASYRGRRVGALGDIGTFSFQSSKNLTSGEGGIMLTADPALAEALYSFVNVGRVPGGGWYEHRTLGYNLRLTELQGAVLRAQLAAFPALQEKRERAAVRLDAALAGIDGLRLARVDASTTEHGRHLHMLRVPGLGEQGLRDAAVAALKAEGVAGAFGGYVPLHRSEALLGEADAIADRLGQPRPARECPVTDTLCADTIWLDQRTLLADDDHLDGVAEAFAKVLSQEDALRDHVKKENG